MGETVRFGELYEWDEEKAAENPINHDGVTFEESTSLFDDANALFEFDFEHSTEEDRFKAIGLSNGGQTLVVSYTYREHRMRIISARKAEPREERQYANEPKG